MTNSSVSPLETSSGAASINCARAAKTFRMVLAATEQMMMEKRRPSRKPTGLMRLGWWNTYKTLQPSVRNTGHFLRSMAKTVELERCPVPSRKTMRSKISSPPLRRSVGVRGWTLNPGGSAPLDLTVKASRRRPVRGLAKVRCSDQHHLEAIASRVEAIAIV